MFSWLDHAVTSWIPGLGGLLELSTDVQLTGLAFPTAQGTQTEAWLPQGSWALKRMVRDMGTKRRREFLAGRLCAYRSLLAMGVVSDFPLATRDRLPVWPSGVLGSISHCTSIAVAMTAPRSRFHALGVDVESLITPATVADIQRSVGSDSELVFLAGAIPCRARALTLLFSAKEALYKALYPLVRQFKDFHAAEIVDCETKSLVLRLTEDWSDEWPRGTCAKVQYVWLNDEVLTAICLPHAQPIHS